MADIVDVMLAVNAKHYSFEAANVRHEHEWRLWQDVKLPEGKVLLPGVVSHATNVIEHPEVVADRIVRYAEAVGRENVDRLDRLRPRRPRAPADRLGQARGAQPGRGARDRAALALSGRRGPRARERSGRAPCVGFATPGGRLCVHKRLKELQNGARQTDERSVVDGSSSAGAPPQTGEMTRP